jgi:hypothetical protein
MKCEVSPLQPLYKLIKKSEKMYSKIIKTRCVMKHKCPHTRQIPEVAIITKTQGQDFKIYSSDIKVLSQVTCI